MRDHVKEYYGQTLGGSQDLQTDACCTLEAPPAHILAIEKNIHPEVSSHYYGCGLVVPDALAGLDVLDLGSGSGKDVYLLAALVGERGRVVGVDMTDEQLAIAERHIDHHRDAFGFAQSNVEFHHGYIEKLDALGFGDASFDLVVSNCVINLSTDKRAVLEQVYRLLRNGGEMYFSDVYADRRIPDELACDPLLYGECLSGALYWRDFLELARACGFSDPRLVEDRPLTIDNDSIRERVGDITFYSATYRLFKADNLEPGAEDYGQMASYRGSIDHAPDNLRFDKQHQFETGQPLAISGNTAQMLKQSRFAEHFDIRGDADHHYGHFFRDEADIPFDREHNSAVQQCC